MDRLASQHHREHWDEHRSVAIWIQDFTDFATTQLEEQVKQEKASSAAQVENGTSTSPYMDMSPEIDDPEEKE